MTYQSLATKWRPKNFDEVVGQSQTLLVLKNSLLQQRFHQAHLFSGTRGIGKTTLARIIAKCLNCQTGITPTPCNRCDSCQEINWGNFVDLVEVDAASRTKVEDTRLLLDNVQYLPTKGRYKVYLIDEVHMLSGHSFNALLKTLEEPPKHVKFLLATTEPQKLPITILSRCLHLKLTTLEPSLIKKHLAQILITEGFSFEDQALHYLATSAKGSIRDALNLLEQTISLCETKQLTTQKVKNLLRIADTDQVFKLAELLLEGNLEAILKIIEELDRQSVDFKTVLDHLLEILHNVALQHFLSLTKTNSIESATIQQLANGFTKEEVQLYYQIAIIGKRDLTLAPTEKIGFEMIMLRMLAFQPNSKPLASLLCKPKALTSSSKTTKPEEAECTKSLKIDDELLNSLNLTNASKILLQHCAVEQLDHQSIKLSLDPKQTPLLNKNQLDRISKAFADYYGRKITVEIIPSTNSLISTYASKKQKETVQREQATLERLKKNQEIKEIVDTFGAEVLAVDTPGAND